MDKAERFDRLFREYREGENERIAAWAAVHRKLTAIAHGADTVGPTSDELAALQSARRLVAEAERKIYDFMTQEFAIDLPADLVRRKEGSSQG